MPTDGLHCFLSCPKSYKPVLFTAHHEFLILLCWLGEARSSLSLTRTSASIPPALEAKTMEQSWLWWFRRICWEEREQRIAEMMWIYHDRNQFQTRVYGSCSTSRSYKVSPISSKLLEVISICEPSVLLSWRPQGQSPDCSLKRTYPLPAFILGF